MATEILRLQGFNGPNLYGPQPSVLLQVRANKDRSRRLKDALKDGGQSIGIVIGYLDVSTDLDGDAYLITVHFATPTPELGVELAHYVVAGLNAKEAGDEAWDAEGPLWDLQKRRRAEALPLPALQLTAEAASRGVPTMLRHDGLLQVGYGVRSWTFDPATLKEPDLGLKASDIGMSAPFARSPVAIDVPWEQVGPIPIMAVAGGASRDIAAQLLAATLYTQEPATTLAAPADFDATQTLLADPSAAIAVVGLTPDSIAQRGLAFERCAYSAVTDLPEQLPPEVADREELARVLGVPMLVTDPTGHVALNADVPEIAALAEYAPCQVIYVSATAENSTVAFHRASGGTALFVRDGAVIGAAGAAEQAVAAATLPPAQLPGALAALALLRAMGLTWEQIIPAMRAG